MTAKAEVSVSTVRPAPFSTYSAIKKTCPECCVSFETKSRTKLFCSDAHKHSFHNRCAVRGKVLIPLAMAWRSERGSSDTAKRAFKRVCNLLDSWSAEDRREGRLPMADYVSDGFSAWHRG